MKCVVNQHSPQALEVRLGIFKTWAEVESTPKVGRTGDQAGTDLCDALADSVLVVLGN